MNKKSLFLCGLMLPSMLMMSCAKGKSSISFFYYSSNDSFITNLAKNLGDRFEDEYKISQFYAENSQAQQNNQITNAIDKGTDLLVVNIFDRLSASSIIEKAKTKDLPVIFINREPLINDIIYEPNVYYVGTDPIYEGKKQAEIVDELFGGYRNYQGSVFDKNNDGVVQVFMLKGEQGHQDSEIRTSYSINTLKSFGYPIEIIQTKTCDWDPIKAKAEFGKSYPDLLDENGKSRIELLISNNDDMAFGAIDFIKTLEDYDAESTIIEQYFPIVGVNGTQEGIESVKKGDMYGTVQNDFVAQSDAIYKLATKLINKESLDNFEYKFDNERFIHVEGKSIIYDKINEKVD